MMLYMWMIFSMSYKIMKTGFLIFSEVDRKRTLGSGAIKAEDLEGFSDELRERLIAFSQWR